MLHDCPTHKGEVQDADDEPEGVAPDMGTRGRSRVQGNGFMDESKRIDEGWDAEPAKGWWVRK